MKQYCSNCKYFIPCILESEVIMCKPYYREDDKRMKRKVVREQEWRYCKGYKRGEDYSEIYLNWRQTFREQNNNKEGEDK